MSTSILFTQNLYTLPPKISKLVTHYHQQQFTYYPAVQGGLRKFNLERLHVEEVLEKESNVIEKYINF